jgi:hypothetical protein
VCGVDLFESAGCSVAISFLTQANKVYSTYAILYLPERKSRNLYSSHRAGFLGPLISISI